MTTSFPEAVLYSLLPSGQQKEGDRREAELSFCSVLWNSVKIKPRLRWGLNRCKSWRVAVGGNNTLNIENEPSAEYNKLHQTSDKQFHFQDYCKAYTPGSMCDVSQVGNRSVVTVGS